MDPFVCPVCGHTQTPAASAGDVVVCGHCGATLRISRTVAGVLAAPALAADLDALTSLEFVTLRNARGAIVRPTRRQR